MVHKNLMYLLALLYKKMGKIIVNVLFITSVGVTGEGKVMEIASFHSILRFLFKSKYLANNVLIYLVIIYNNILFVIIINKILNK
jgi:hypothetical protein